MRRRRRSGYRHKARFVADWRNHSTPLDRNLRARILYLAEMLELRTKKRGRRNGALGQIGLQMLRCLMLNFANRQTGRCDPSYQALQDATGLCRAAVAAALARLERAGILTITRRLVRQAITRLSAITGQPETIITTTQWTSLYAFAKAPPWAYLLPTAPARPSPFPTKRQLDLFAGLAALSETIKIRWASRTESTEQGETQKSGCR